MIKFLLFVIYLISEINVTTSRLSFNQFGRKTIKGNNKVDKSDADLRTPEIIKKYGYKSEIYEAISKDGYRLALHRIASPGRPVVALFHGILCSSKEWLLPVTGSTKDSFGFMLADAGYDVWMFNTRGNHYSIGHAWLVDDSIEYWDFGVDEMAKYDIPATIDYILGVTNQTKLTYIGFSLGTILFFKGMAETPEYNNKISLFVGLAPGATFGNVSAFPFRLIATMINPEEPLKNLLSIVSNNRGFLATYFQPIVRPLWKIVCGTARFICDGLVYEITGYSPGKIIDDIWDVILGEFPSRTSIRTIIDVLQATRVPEPMTLKYNFGSGGNMRVYGTRNPPRYDLSKVTVPVAMFYGKTDSIITSKDTESTAEMLPNVIFKRKVNYPDTWGHQDYYLSILAPELVYKPAINLIKDFS